MPIKNSFIIVEWMTYITVYGFVVCWQIELEDRMKLTGFLTWTVFFNLQLMRTRLQHVRKQKLEQIQNIYYQILQSILSKMCQKNI